MEVASMEAASSADLTTYWRNKEKTWKNDTQETVTVVCYRAVMSIKLPTVSQKYGNEEPFENLSTMTRLNGYF